MDPMVKISRCLTAVAALLVMTASVSSAATREQLLNAAAAFVFVHYNPQEAIRSLREIMIRYPDWEEPYALLSYVFRRERNFREAEAVAGIYLKKHTDSPVMLYEMALSSLESGKPEKFPKIWERIDSGSRNKSEFHSLHAQYLYRIGRYREAAVAYAAARDTATAPRMATEAALACVEAMTKEGNAESVLAESWKAYRAGRLTARDRMTLLGYMEGDPDRGGYLRRALALELEEEGPHAMYEGVLARTFLANGDYARAALHAMLDLESAESEEKKVTLAEALARGGATDGALRYLKDISEDRLAPDARARFRKTRSFAYGEGRISDHPAGGAKLGHPGSPIDFGTARGNTPVRITVTLRNDGSEELLVYRVAPSVEWVSGSLSKRTIPPGQGMDITVWIAPQGERGNREFDLTVYSNDPGSPKSSVHLVGVYE